MIQLHNSLEIRIAITDEVNGGTLNKVMAYTDGSLANITTTYTA